MRLSTAASAASPSGIVVPRMGDVLEKNMAHNAKEGANVSLCFSVQIFVALLAHIFSLAFG
jgi:hypothetical protein